MPLQVFGNNCLIGLILAKKISGVKIDRLSYLSVKVVPASSVLPPVMYASSLPVTANIYTPYKQPQSARREDRSQSIAIQSCSIHPWLTSAASQYSRRLWILHSTLGIRRSSATVSSTDSVSWTFVYLKKCWRWHLSKFDIHGNKAFLCFYRSLCISRSCSIRFRIFGAYIRIRYYIYINLYIVLEFQTQQVFVFLINITPTTKKSSTLEFLVQYIYYIITWFYDTYKIRILHWMEQLWNEWFRTGA